MAKVSVIVPVYNTEKYLRKCIDSLLNQTLKDLEIIIVNDSSPDNSQEIIDEYVTKFPNKIKSIIKENGGQGSARNLGLEASSGEYIGYVDSDDFVDIHMYEDMLNQAIKDNSDIVDVGFYIYSESGKVIKEDIYISERTPTNLNETKQLLFDKTAVTNKLYRASLLKDNNIKFREKKWYEDFDFVIKTICYAKKVSIIPKSYYYYLLRQGSTMNNSNAERNLEILEAMDEILKFFKEQNIYSEYIEELEFLAVFHIYLPTNVRIIRSNVTWAKKHEIIHKINSYMDSNFSNYKKNKYIKTFLPKRKRHILTLIKLKLYWIVWLCFKFKDLLTRRK